MTEIRDSMTLMSDPLLQLRYKLTDAVLRHDDSFLMGGKNPLDILRATRVFLSQKILWTSNALAQDDAGNAVRPNHPRASSWSVEGAVAIMCNEQAVFPLFFGRLLDRVMHLYFAEYVERALDTGSAATFGDFETIYNYEVVMQVLDAAIGELEHAQVHSGS